MDANTAHRPTNPLGRGVDADETGYAVGEGQLRIDGDRFELDLSLNEMNVVMEAVRSHPEISDVLAQPSRDSEGADIGFKGGTYRGDFPALAQVVTALKRYENTEAGIGEDKLAYDARTSFNHARGVVRRALKQGEDVFADGE